MFERGADMLDRHSTAGAGNLLMRGAGTEPDYLTAHKFFKQTKVSLAWLGLAGLGLAWLGLAWLGLACFWLGLIWLALLVAWLEMG